jgi:hypothetical protein
MEPEYNNDSESNDLGSNQRIHQNSVDAQNQVNQQAVIGDSNVLQNSVSIREEISEDKPTELNPNRNEQDITQQAASGDGNVLSSNKLESRVNIYFDSRFTDLIPKVSPDSDREKSLQEHFIDPTTELQLQNEAYPDVIPGETQKFYQQKLIENRLIFISCADQETSWQVGCALADKIDAFNKRLLTGEKDSLKYLNTISIETLLDRRIGSNGSTLFIVDASELQTFLDSVTVRQPSRANEIRNALRENQRFCICLVDREALKLSLKASRIEKFLFDCWEIQEQEEQEEQESKYFIDSDECFDRLISELQDDNWLTKTVLFTSSFFPQLSLSDFEKIVFSLVGNQSKSTKFTKSNEVVLAGDTKTQISVLIEGEKITINKSDSPKNDYTLNQTDADDLVLLHQHLQEWNLDSVLDSCCLTYVPGSSSGKVIDFRFPGLREKFVEYFEKKHFFLSQRFQRLINLGLLVDDSPKISKYIREIAAKVILYSNEEEYRRRWLRETILSILSDENNSKSPKVKAYHLNCITELLREILNYSELEHLVNQALEELIASRKHDAALQIAKKLKFAPQFNELYWFKRLIACSPDSIRLATYRTLSNELKQSNLRLYDNLEEIKAWLPPASCSKLEPLDQLSLQLLPEYVLEMLANFESDSWDSSTIPVHPLFNGLRNNNTALARVEILVSWLLHPKLNSVIGGDIDPIGLAAISILPKILLAIHCVEDKEQQPELELMENYFIQGIVNVADFYEKETGIKYKQCLLGYWEGWIEYLKIQINYLKSSQKRKLATKWNRERNVVRHLIKKFRTLSR